jgi:hypothetical protein
MTKMQITFDGFRDLAEAIDKAEGNLNAAVDEALSETQDIVQKELRTAAQPYKTVGGSPKGYSTGSLYNAIIDDRQPVEWAGTTATVKVGFSSKKNRNGFMHSIFVMYGTPKMSKDPKIYNAIKGSRTKKLIAEAQRRTLEKYLKLGGGQ